MYSKPPLDSPVFQGDIFDNCPFVCVSPDSSDESPLGWTSIGGTTRVVVLTQACDMMSGKVHQVVVAVVHTAKELVESGLLKANNIRDRIRRHQVYGWYFLPNNEKLGLVESVVDLRNLHTIPLALLEKLVDQRLCRLETPYREHMNQHFGSTYGRIGLPELYETEE